MKPLEGRTALVTGAGRAGSMGRSHALTLAALGANVIAADMDPAGVTETTDAAAALGVKAYPLVADVRDLASFRHAVGLASTAVGPVGILVNNAGVGGRRLAFEDVDTEAFDAMFDVNVRAVFFLTQALAPAMKAAGWGRIINISSQFGVTGSSNASHYAGAKAALLGLTKTWARELGPFGITVNAVAPGYIDTPMTARTAAEPARLEARLRTIPVGRKGEAADVSRAVAWLASPDAGFVTGQVISPNGGEAIY